MSDQNIPYNYPEELHPVYEAIRRLAERFESSQAGTQQAMQFILEQQAQSTVKIDRLTEQVGALAEAKARAASMWERTEGSVRDLLAVAEIQAGEIKDLSESVKAVDQRQRRTDDRLDALITAVERYISERGNGKS